MKNINKIMFLSGLLFLFSACTDFLDVNDDPNNPVDATMEALLAPAIVKTSSAHFSISYSGNQATQQVASVFGYFEELQLGGAWSTLYLRSMNNLDALIQKAADNDSPHYEGVAKVLMAINIGMLTDTYEDAPYVQAFDGSEDFTPMYDSQVSLYTEINALLDDGIKLLETEESISSPGSEDLAHGGSIEAWIKTANALKARYALHLSNQGAANYAAALTAVDNAYTSNGDDLQVTYNDVNKNPWHDIALSNNTGNLSVTLGSYYINHLNGTISGVVDPRLSIVTTVSNDIAQNGGTSYDPDAPESSVEFQEEGWYSNVNATIELITYAEVKFIEAEAAFTTDKARSYQAYLDGIAANMNKLGVDAASIDTYLADPAIGVGEANLGMNHIMREKYVALFLNPETWVDMRRHGYSTAVYEGFVTPDTDIYGNLPQRSLYPQDEFDRNLDEVSKVEKESDVKMWRDQ